MQGLNLFAFAPGPMELLIVAGVVLLLFGSRLPSVMRGLGQSVSEFQKGVRGVESEIEEVTR